MSQISGYRELRERFREPQSQDTPIQWLQP